MDLLNTIHKEGSRGGRGDFKWEDVKDSAHRENYLGHSLMAPVGRWQQGRDLGWYANSKDSAEAAAAAQLAREEEKRLVKEAEDAAISAALGLAPIIPGATNEGGNANNTPLGQSSRLSNAKNGEIIGRKGTRERRHRSRSREPSHRSRHGHGEEHGSGGHRRHRHRDGQRDNRSRRRSRSRTAEGRHNADRNTGRRRDERYQGRSEDRGPDRDKKESSRKYGYAERSCSERRSRSPRRRGSRDRHG